MADRGGFFAKTVQKHAGRAKEKFLQNLGKADKTTDEIFDEYVNNFKKQENSANKLQKEIKNYINCVRAMQAASKALFDTVNETYELDWVGRDQVYIKSQAIEMMWSDFNHKLSEQVLIPLNTYQNQFAEVRKRVDKRGRKLVDYDCARHAYESLLSNTKKKDEAKLSKTREQLEDTRRLYEILNSELYDELPALYDSRIPFLISNLQTIFSAEAVFHHEITKVNQDLSDVMDELAAENQKGTYSTKKYHASSPISPKGKSTEESSNDQPENSNLSAKEEADARQYEEIDFKKGEPGSRNSAVLKDVAVQDRNGEVTENSHESPGTKKNEAKENVSQEYQNEQNQADDGKLTSANNEARRVEELYDIPVGATTENLPPGVLYRVRATYRYVAEDEDELSFEVGEIIQVTEYEDPEDQEEGWLVGIKESTEHRGLFPANFTRPI